MTENETISSERQDEYFIRGEAVSKSNCPTSFNVNRTDVPPSLSYFEGKFWLSTVVWVGDNVVDLRHPLTKREVAYLTSQAARAMSQYFAYQEAGN